MAKASKSLSQDLNNNRVGRFGGSKASDINPPGHNQRQRESDTDSDGIPDTRVAQELSEDNSKWPTPRTQRAGR